MHIYRQDQHEVKNPILLQTWNKLRRSKMVVVLRFILGDKRFQLLKIDITYSIRIKSNHDVFGDIHECLNIKTNAVK